jgi:hypothetical protein
MASTHSPPARACSKQRARQPARRQTAAHLALPLAGVPQRAGPAGPGAVHAAVRGAPAAGATTLRARGERYAWKARARHAPHADIQPPTGTDASCALQLRLHTPAAHLLVAPERVLWEVVLVHEALAVPLGAADAHRALQHAAAAAASSTLKAAAERGAAAEACPTDGSIRAAAPPAAAWSALHPARPPQPVTDRPGRRRCRGRARPRRRRTARMGPRCRRTARIGSEPPLRMKEDGGAGGGGGVGTDQHFSI